MALGRDQQRRILSASKSLLGRRYARRGLGERLGGLLGGWGQMLGMAVDVFLEEQGHATGLRRPKKLDELRGAEQDRQILEAIDLLERSGFRISEGVEQRILRPQSRIVPPPLPEELEPQGRGVRQVRRPPSVVQDPYYVPEGFRTPSSKPITPVTPEYDEVDTRLLMAPLVTGGEDDVFSQMIRTPESSNVYAIGYDHDVGVLYVQYRAPGKPEFYSDQLNTCSGLEYQMGHRADQPGPIYAYGSRATPVIPSMWDRLVAAPSKGEWIWQNLRICGTNWGHRFTYTLTNPSQVGNRIYVPRRASPRGFRTRSVSVPGSGRRDFFVSGSGYDDPRRVHGAARTARQIMQQRQARRR